MTAFLFELEDAERAAREEIATALLVEKAAELALDEARVALSRARDARRAATQALTDALDAIEDGAA